MKIESRMDGKILEYYDMIFTPHMVSPGIVRFRQRMYAGFLDINQGTVAEETVDAFRSIRSDLIWAMRLKEEA